MDIADIEIGATVRMTDLRRGVTEPVTVLGVDVDRNRVTVAESNGARWSVAPGFLAPVTRP